MAQTHLVDERAALDLLQAVFMQARKDCNRRSVSLVNRLDAALFFAEVDRLYADSEVGRNDPKHLDAGATGAGRHTGAPLQN